MNRFLLSLLVLLTLCGGAFSQQMPRRVPSASPYSISPLPSPNTPHCAFNMTVDPFCLEAAMGEYGAAASAAMSEANGAWNVAKDAYATTVANEIIILNSSVPTCNGHQGCIDAFIATYDAAILAAHANFVASTNAIWTNFTAAIDAAKAQYNATTELCCLDLGFIDPTLYFPDIKLCDASPTSVNILCEDGQQPWITCKMACNAVYTADLAAACAGFDVQAQTAYASLISELTDALTAFEVAAGLCPDAPCLEAAEAAYNITFNQAWETYHDAYLLIVQAADAKKAALLADLVTCIQGCCP